MNESENDTVTTWC